MIDGDPFAAPVELRDPTRRLRARLAAPVTLWTAGTPDTRAGLTVSSVLIAEGDPARVLGLVTPNSGLWDALVASGAFVMHVLEHRHRVVAQRFAGQVPAPGGPFEGLEVGNSTCGPVLAEIATRAGCRVEGWAETGYAYLVTGVVESLDIGDVDDPLVYFKARYARLTANVD